MTGRFLVWGSRENDLPSHISVKFGGSNSIVGSISIKPVNRMFGKFDVLERPLEKFYLSPVKDSTIRENIPTLNYGSDTGMMVGVDEYNGEKFRSLIQFDFTTVPLNKTLKKAIMRIYNSPFSSDVNIALFNILNNWLEKDVTWANQPRQGEKILTQHISFSQNGFIEVDVFPLVKKWYEGLIPNYGMMLSADDETKLASILFGTRESSFPPELELGFEMPVYNDGVSNLPSSLTVQVSTQNELLMKMNVVSKYREEVLPSLLRIEQKNSSTTLLSSLEVSVKASNQLQSSLQINKILDETYLSGLITVPTNDDLKSSINVEKLNGANSLIGKMVVRHTEDLSSSINVEKLNGVSDLLLSLQVRGQNDLSSSITVPKNNDLLGRIRVEFVNELPSSILVKYGDDLTAQMHVIGREQNDLNSCITVRVKMASDLPSVIRVVDVSKKSNMQYAFII